MVNWLHTLSSLGTARTAIHAVPGSRMKDDRLLQMVDGHYELVTVGQSDLYAEIQSHKDSVDINKLLERYRNGDTGALQHVVGQYMDIVDAPKTLAEAYEYIHNAKAFFYNLPLDIRKEYDHDASAFIRDLGSDHSRELFSKVFGSSDSELAAGSVSDSPVAGDLKEVNGNA